MKYKKNYKKSEQGKYVEILGFSNRDRDTELVKIALNWI
jgi:hypothetical protein